MSSLRVHALSFPPDRLSPKTFAAIGILTVAFHAGLFWLASALTETRGVPAEIQPIYAQWIVPPAQAVEPVAPNATPQKPVAKPTKPHRAIHPKHFKKTPERVVKKEERKTPELPLTHSSPQKTAPVQASSTPVAPSATPDSEQPPSASPAQTVKPEPSTPATPSGAPGAKTISASQVRYLVKPSPVYPPVSLRLGEEGSVLVRVLIGENGRSEKMNIVRSSGSPRLDQAALDAIEGARFVPFRENGSAEAVWVQIPIKFTLH
jgi:protein TonB